MALFGLCLCAAIILLGAILSLVKRQDLILYFAVAALFVAQLFILIPGHYANYDDGVTVRFYSIFGTSVSTIISAVIILYLFVKLFIYYLKVRVHSFDLLIITSFIVMSIFSFFGSASLSNKISTFSKLLLPLELFLFIKNVGLRQSYSKRLLVLINLFLIGQTLLCRILTGKFAASIFYVNLSSEFFGFYNSPHPLCAALCFLSIFLLSEFVFSKRSSRFFYLLLFVLDQAFMYLLGTTSYLVADILGILLMLALSLTKRNRAIKAKLTIPLFPLILLTVPFIVLAITNSRIFDNLMAGNVTNGRTERWFLDINYFFDHLSIKSFLIGDGFYSVYSINKVISNNEINSLNYFIDMLLDSGLLGLVCFTSILISIFIFFKPAKETAFYWQLIFVFSFSAFSNNIVPYITVMTLMIIVLDILKNNKKEFDSWNCLTEQTF